MSQIAAKIRLVDIGIVFRPRNRDPIVACRDVSFDVSECSIVSIVGPSGCGKSTLLNIVSGLMAPSKGLAEVDGRAVAGIRHDVGYMFARDGMMPWRTALQNVEFGLEVRRVPHRREIAREWLRRVGLDKFEGHYRHELSQGMRQRVAVARTFAIEPNILLMDQPSGPGEIHGADQSAAAASAARGAGRGPGIPRQLFAHLGGPQGRGEEVRLSGWRVANSE